MDAGTGAVHSCAAAAGTLHDATQRRTGPDDLLLFDRESLGRNRGLRRARRAIFRAQRIHHFGLHKNRSDDRLLARAHLAVRPVVRPRPSRRCRLVRRLLGQTGTSPRAQTAPPRTAAVARFDAKGDRRVDRTDDQRPQRIVVCNKFPRALAPAPLPAAIWPFSAHGAVGILNLSYAPDPSKKLSHLRFHLATQSHRSWSAASPRFLREARRADAPVAPHSVRSCPLRSHGGRDGLRPFANGTQCATGNSLLLLLVSLRHKSDDAGPSRRHRARGNEGEAKKNRRGARLCA